MSELASVWLDKIKSANRYYDNWSKKFKTDALEKYYEGFQWADSESDSYIINLFYSTIETKMPSLVFQNPTFRVTPKPQDLLNDPEGAFSISSNLEDIINDLIREEKLAFSDEVEAAILDAWFRYGIIEVGYSTDWIDNPNAGRPVIKSDYSNYYDSQKNVLRQPAKLPTNERVYVRYIPAKTFRVSTIDHRFLHRCNWCGYYEFIRLEDLLANPKFRKIDRVQYAGFRSEEFFPDDYEERGDLIRSGDYVLIWKIWDNRNHKRYLISDVHQEVLSEDSFDFLPFSELRFKKRLREFYPVPPSFNWISPQNEINEAREANRNHRRRFRRHFWAQEGAVDKDELQKVINGPDGTIITVSRPDSIGAIQTAELGASAAIAMNVTKDDFNIISGTTSEQRGESDRTTATQASITNQRATIRESRERLQVANFMVRIAKLMIETVRTKFVNTMYVGTNVTNENLKSDYNLPKEINPISDLGQQGFDYNVNISVESMSPVTNEEEKKKLIEFMVLLKQFPEYSMNPLIIREIAFRVGYKNERIIKEFQQFAQLQLMGQVEQGMANLQGQQGQGGNMANNQLKQMTPPTMEQTQNQLAGQGVPVQ